MPQPLLHVSPSTWYLSLSLRYSLVSHMECGDAFSTDTSNKRHASAVLLLLRKRLVLTQQQQQQQQQHTHARTSTFARSLAFPYTGRQAESPINYMSVVLVRLAPYVLRTSIFTGPYGRGHRDTSHTHPRNYFWTLVKPHLMACRHSGARPGVSKSRVFLVALPPSIPPCYSPSPELSPRPLCTLNSFKVSARKYSGQGTEYIRLFAFFLGVALEILSTPDGPSLAWVARGRFISCQGPPAYIHAMTISRAAC